MKTLLALALAALFSVPALASAADYKWAIEEVEATRWKDGGKVVGKADANKRLEVLAEDGDKVRVRIDGSKFGWIASSKLSDTDPAKTDAPADEPVEE
jgi:uncharacterized protein YgiM (DUF1202 family)